MVKFRGIEISIVSQFDIRTIPEFEYTPASPSPDPFNDLTSTSVSNFTASCYIPIYPGSQIWFEYTIDGPHPPNAAYFFKLLVNGEEMTSWDCTSKHGYHGKMMYNLIYEGKDDFTGDSLTRRQAIRFGSEVDSWNSPVNHEDVVEIKIHRIEHRQRIKNLDVGLGQIDIGRRDSEHLRLTNGGLLEAGLPQRRYKYQLLDPVDEPYAAFRFYYRTYEYLESHGIIARSERPGSSSPSTVNREDSPGRALSDTAAQVQHSAKWGTHVTSPIQQTIRTLSPTSEYSVEEDLSEKETGEPSNHDHDTQTDTYLPPSDSEESLSIVTRDSIEELPSSVPRPPMSPRKSTSGMQEDETAQLEDPLSPTRAPHSPKRKLKKKLTVNLNGAEFNLEKKNRPLSPFTNAGVLRRFGYPVPPSAPAVLTEFGPTIFDEADSKLLTDAAREIESTRLGSKGRKGSTESTTSSQRRGKALMDFLGRRIGRTG